MRMSYFAYLLLKFSSCALVVSLEVKGHLQSELGKILRIFYLKNCIS